MKREAVVDWENVHHRKGAKIPTLRKMLVKAQREQQLVYMEYCERSLQIERAIADIENRLGR